MHTFKKTTRFIAILCILALASCGGGKEYTIEDMAIPSDYKLPDSVAKNLDSVYIPWQRFFKDTVLVRLIDSAFLNNFSIRQANKEIAINEQYYKKSKLAFLPSFNLNLLNIEREWTSKYSGDSPESAWYDNHNKTPTENMFVSGSEFSTSLTMDWEIGIWGKFRKQKTAAKAYFEQSYE